VRTALVLGAADVAAPAVAGATIGLGPRGRGRRGVGYWSGVSVPPGC